MFWAVVAALAVVQARILFTALRIRATPDPARGLVGSRPMDMVWTILPVFILAAIVLLSFQALQDRNTSSSEPEAASTSAIELTAVQEHAR